MKVIVSKLLKSNLFTKDYGYLDQHSKLADGNTIRDVLKDAFLPLLEQEKELILISEKMATATPEDLDDLLRDMGDIQERLESSGFYLLDVKVDDLANGLGLDAIGLDRDVTSLS